MDSGVSDIETVEVVRWLIVRNLELLWMMTKYIIIIR